MVVFIYREKYHYTWIPWAITESFFLKVCYVIFFEMMKVGIYWNFYCHQKNMFCWVEMKKKLLGIYK